MRAQAAFEYMLVVIIALAFMIPLWVYLITVNTEANDELSLSYARNAVDAIASAADLVYTQGAPAMVRIRVNMPAGVESASLTNNTIILNVRRGAGPTTVFATSRARLNGTLPTSGGSYWLDIRAVDDASCDVDIQRA